MELDEIRTISVIGSGLMGHGIAQEFALKGYAVRMHDRDQATLDAAMAQIERNLDLLSGIGLVTDREKKDTPSRIEVGTELDRVVDDSDFVVEAVFEDLSLKQGIFASLDRLCPERTILASNTSTLLPGNLASATRRPDRVLVTHYFNPPYLLPLVEIVRGSQTSDETVETAFGLFERIGKTPVKVQKEIPGFIGNRLQAALFREALSIVQSGIATPQDIDTVIKNGFGRRLAAAGVFEIWGIAGWDLILAICQNLFPDLESGPEVPTVLQERVDRGELGVKTGKGFYNWSTDSVNELKNRIASTLIHIAKLRERDIDSHTE